MTEPGPQFRTDVLTGQQVIIAPHRSLRPSSSIPDPLLSLFPDPFEEGQESETPDERLAVRLEGSAPNEPGWTLRVVPNRYPAVIARSEAQNPSNAEATGDEEFFPWRPACGEHDVVIECPDSRSRMVDLSPAEIMRTLIAWRTRMQQLARSPGIRSVAIFRNEGFSAGASLAHSHSQIVATEEMTPLDIARHQTAALHRTHTGRDLVQDLWIAEHRQTVRVISETEFFGVYCPFASHTSWQIRFMLKQEQPNSFSAVTDDMLHELAVLLKSSLLSLESIMKGRFSFNLTLSHPRIDQPPAFSWHLDLLPRTGRIAGFELLTGIDIVTVTPESAAAGIRSGRLS